MLFLSGGFTPSILGLIMSRATDGKIGFRNLIRRSCQLKLSSTWYLLTLTIIAFGGLVHILLNGISGNGFDYGLFEKQIMYPEVCNWKYCRLLTILLKTIRNSRMEFWQN